MSDEDRATMVNVVSTFLTKLLKQRIKRAIIAALPRHHASILRDMFRGLNSDVVSKVVLIPYGRKAFRTLRKVYEAILNDSVLPDSSS